MRRYDCDYTDKVFEKSPTGEWVKYEDVEVLKHQLDSMAKIYQAMVDNVSVATDKRVETIVKLQARNDQLKADIKVLSGIVLHDHGYRYGISTKTHYPCTCQACEISRKYKEVK